MKWHAQEIRCKRVTVLRGYRKGNYRLQSPYQSLMLVLTRGSRREVQGFLTQGRLTKRDLAGLAALCRRKGISLLTTRRHGRPAQIPIP